MSNRPASLLTQRAAVGKRGVSAPRGRVGEDENGPSLDVRSRSGFDRFTG